MAQGTDVAQAMEKIRSSAERMGSDSEFKCIFEEWPPVSDDDFVEWEAWADTQSGMSGYRVPQPLRSIYRVTGGFRWRWQYLPDMPSVVTTGSAELVDLLSLYQRDDEASTPLSTIYRSPRRFDVIGEHEFVGIRFAPGASSLPLVHVDEEESVEAEMQMDVETYPAMIARYHAIYGWQTLFHRKAKQRDEVESRLDATLKRVFR